MLATIAIDGKMESSSSVEQPSKEQLGLMSSKALSVMLKDRQLKRTGIKSALINRLYDNWTKPTITGAKPPTKEELDFMMMKTPDLWARRYEVMQALSKQTTSTVAKDKSEKMGTPEPNKLQDKNLCSVPLCNNNSDTAGIKIHRPTNTGAKTSSKEELSIMKERSPNPCVTRVQIEDAGPEQLRTKPILKNNIPEKKRKRGRPMLHTYDHNKRFCCVPLCKNNSDTPGVELHRIPDEQNIRHQWLARLHNVRSNLSVTCAARVCSAHFDPSAYDNGVLSPTAYPSVFCGSEQTKPTTTKNKELGRPVTPKLNTQDKQFCSVPLCDNNSDTPGVKLHRVPDHQDVRRQWLARLHSFQFNLSVSSATRVCSAHFDPSAYDNGILNPKAYPSVFCAKLFPRQNLGRPWKEAPQKSAKLFPSRGLGRPCKEAPQKSAKLLPNRGLGRPWKEAPQKSAKLFPSQLLGRPWKEAPQKSAKLIPGSEQNNPTTPKNKTIGKPGRPKHTGQEHTQDKEFCSVPLCDNNSDTPGVTLHRVPDEQDVRHQWLARLHSFRFNLSVSSATRVCSAHFDPSAYDNGILNPKAYPSVFCSKLFPSPSLGRPCKEPPRNLAKRFPGQSLGRPWKEAPRNLAKRFPGQSLGRPWKGAHRKLTKPFQGCDCESKKVDIDPKMEGENIEETNNKSARCSKCFLPVKCERLHGYKSELKTEQVNVEQCLVKHVKMDTTTEGSPNARNKFKLEVTHADPGLLNLSGRCSKCSLPIKCESPPELKTDQVHVEQSLDKMDTTTEQSPNAANKFKLEGIDGDPGLIKMQTAAVRNISSETTEPELTSGEKNTADIYQDQTSDAELTSAVQLETNEVIFPQKKIKLAAGRNPINIPQINDDVTPSTTTRKTGNCQVHQDLVKIGVNTRPSHNPEEMEKVEFADQNITPVKLLDLPNELYASADTMGNQGGIWTKRSLPKGYTFGPLGKDVLFARIQDKHQECQGKPRSLAEQVINMKTNGETQPADPRTSWIQQINWTEGAKANVARIIMANKMFLITQRTLQPHTELLLKTIN